MDTYNLKPEHMRAPAHLSKKEVQASLEELDAKIKVLRGRVNATTADSKNTYHEHIAALEAKRELIAQKLYHTEEHHSKWDDLKKGIENLKADIEKMFK